MSARLAGGPTERQAEALALVREGKTVADVARIFGISDRNAHALIKRGKRREEQEAEQPEGVRAAIAAAGAQGLATGGWIKTKGEDGTRVSVQFRLPQEKADPQAWVDALREGLSDFRADAPPRPVTAATQRLAVFPLADLHFGLLCDEEEVGEAWDITKAMGTLRAMVEELVAETPAADVALIGQLGDLLHADDKRGVTPISHHHLDAAKFFRALRAGSAAMKMVIEIARRKFPRVIYRGCRGNHDENVHYAITLALSEHYASCPDVEIVTSAEDAYVHEFGCNLIVLHHGDRMTHDRTHQFVTASYAPAWGRSRYRIAISGHVHHVQAKTIGGMRCESVGTIVPGDVYARSHGFVGWRELVSITLDANRGERHRTRVDVPEIP